MSLNLKRVSLGQWIIVALLAGLFFGWKFPEPSRHLQVLSTIFLHLIKCIIVPLIFSTLVVGIAGHANDLRAVGRLAWKSLLYFEAVTTCALFVGLGAVNLLQPGVGVHLDASNEAGKQLAATKITFESVVEHIAPQSFFDAAARNDVLQVVVFAILFAIALARVKDHPRKTMLAF